MPKIARRQSRLKFKVMRAAWDGRWSVTAIRLNPTLRQQSLSRTRAVSQELILFFDSVHLVEASICFQAFKMSYDFDDVSSIHASSIHASSIHESSIPDSSVRASSVRVPSIHLTETRLVFSIDVGTTYTGMISAIL
jgi:hypothetical protein